MISPNSRYCAVDHLMSKTRKGNVWCTHPLNKYVSSCYQPDHWTLISHELMDTIIDSVKYHHSIIVFHTVERY